jgi:two-component system sensor histidine kinase SenX3
VEPTTQELLLTLLGVVIGAVTALAWRTSERQLHPAATPPAKDLTGVPAGVSTVLNVLESSALVVDEHDEVLQASAPAYSLGLVRAGTIRIPALEELVQQVRRDGQIREADFEVKRGLGHAPIQVQARVATLGSRLVLVLADDRTRERRTDAIRRDFVANVSHELKTPVGALTLLAEAVLMAADDPQAVERFATRMQSETVRLNRLVQQIIELSRLQHDDALERASTVNVDLVVDRAVEAIEVEARTKKIIVRTEGARGVTVLGDPQQLSLALGNLIANAVAYSPEDSTVVVSVMVERLTVDITVADEGVGIAPTELDRIFERFYRVDPARQRSTGGTGLGLSIVKHVAASHGGEVKVWSEPGQGSSFTLRLPRRAGSVDPPSVRGSAAPHAGVPDVQKGVS